MAAVQRRRRRGRAGAAGAAGAVRRGDPAGLDPTPDYAHLLAVLRHPLTRLGLLAVCALSLVHAAHRFRFTLQDGLQLQRFDGPIATVCYGGALAGSAAAAYLLLAVL